MEVELERNIYSATETEGLTEEICAILLVDPDDFVNGTDGVFDAIMHDFDLTSDPVISVQLSSFISTPPDADSTKLFYTNSYILAIENSFLMCR